MAGNAVIGQSGGPTAVINQSLVGAIEELIKQNAAGKVDKILGAKHGVRGIIKEQFVELNGVSKEVLERVAATPSSALGSTRDKPDEAYCHKIFDSFKKHNVNYFFYIGGNDSADTARIVSEMAVAANFPLSVYHIPKTIDNDLRTTDHCPGYGSAGRFVALAHMGDDADNRSLPGIKVNVVMGRDAGWLTAASALARQSDDEGPHLIYLPESDFSEDKFIDDVDRVYTKLGRCVIAASEGIRYLALDKKSLLAEKIMLSNEVDAHGNLQLSGSGALADYLSNLIKTRLGALVTARDPKAKLRVRGDTFGYLQRSFPSCVSPTDAKEARTCGRKAVQYAITGAKKLKSGSVAMKRADGDVYKISFFPTALTNVARQTKPFPTDWIISGNNVSEAFIKYATPLVGELPRTGRLF